jgi:hypothetical protein
MLSHFNLWARSRINQGARSHKMQIDNFDMDACEDPSRCHTEIDLASPRAGICGFPIITTRENSTSDTTGMYTGRKKWRFNSHALEFEHGSMGPIDQGQGTNHCDAALMLTRLGRVTFRTSTMRRSVQQAAMAEDGHAEQAGLREWARSTRNFAGNQKETAPRGQRHAPAEKN